MDVKLICVFSCVVMRLGLADGKTTAWRTLEGQIPPVLGREDAKPGESGTDPLSAQPRVRAHPLVTCHRHVGNVN